MAEQSRKIKPCAAHVALKSDLLAKYSKEM